MRVGSIIIAILMFSLVVIFHELGHFLLAKKNGIGVNEFCLGMGPKLFGFKRGETTYALRLFPIGGACMMVGEDESSEDERAFNNKTVWQRFQVIFAGPFFNFILAFLFAMIMTAISGYDPATVTKVAENSGAAQIGLKEGDVITSIDGTNITFGREIYVKYAFTPVDSEPIKLTYKRDGQKYTATLQPMKDERYLLGFGYTADTLPARLSSVTKGSAFDEAGIKADDVILAVQGTEVATGEELYRYFQENPLTGEQVTIRYERNQLEYEVSVTPRYSESYSLGFSYNTYCTDRANGLSLLKYSAAEVKYWIKTTVVSLGMIFRGKVTANDLGGPVRIVSEISNNMVEAKPYGVSVVIVQLLQWCVLLSANLGVMNLLPIPALDGGRILFLIIEAIRRKPVNREKEAIINAVFFVLLMLLMVFVFYNDIRNLF